MKIRFGCSRVVAFAVSAVFLVCVSCGKKDDDDPPSSYDGSCTTSVVVGSTTYKSCAFYSGMTSVWKASIMDKCGPSDATTTFTWADNTACSADGVIGKCRSTSENTTILTSYYPAYTAAQLKSFCDVVSGTVE